jgi:hypothetical protein
MSLSASAWVCHDEYGRPSALFSKSSKNEDFCFYVYFGDVDGWNCAHQLTGYLSWRKTLTSGAFEIEAEVDTAQRTTFVKVKNGYEHPVAIEVAAELASEYKSEKMMILWDWDSGRYYLECAACVNPEDSYGTATLKMNKNGTATLSGNLYGIYSFTATATLMFDTACGIFYNYLYGEHVYVLFTPVVKMQVCPISSSGTGKCHVENDLVAIYWRPID